MMLGSKTTGIVLDIANQRGGSQPSVVTLHDHSRFGNDGAMTNVTWVQLPSRLWVMSFNGASSNVDCGNDASLHPVTALTLEGWVNLSSAAALGDYPPIISCLHVFVVWAGYRMFLNSNSTVVLVNLNNGPNATIGALTVGEWAYVVATYDSAFIRPYLNGILGTPVAFIDPIVYDPTKVVTLGYGTTTSDYLHGLLALTKIYNYALTPGQILQRFEATRSLFGV